MTDSGNNLEYLYGHLPAFYRRADAEQGLLLKRFLAWFGEECDGVDAQIDTLFEKVSPDTAPEAFLDYFLWSLFGWGYAPKWFTLERKRQFFRDIATHYARRGTAQGIVGLLAAFGITARVFKGPLAWGEWTWGETLEWTVTGPLGLVVQIFPQTDALPDDLSFWGEFTWGEGVLATPSQTLERADYEGLLRFEQPVGHEIVIELLTAE
jgi:phage tail-like protein